MINLPKIADSNLSKERVIVRGDLDVEIPNSKSQISNENILRLQVLKPTIDLIFGKGAKNVILIGHRGRPTGDEDKDRDLSLRNLAEPLKRILGREVIFAGEEVNQLTRLPDGQVNESVNQNVILLENLRFDSREEANNEEYAKELSSLGDFYVNEAFAVSHRVHASIVGIPKLLPHAAGIRLTQEIENLSKVFDPSINSGQGPKKPVVVIIGGAKEDKLSYIEGFLKFADKILLGGRLPDVIQSTSYQLPDTKILVAKLLPDKEDITMHSIEEFEEEIEKAGIVVVAGPVGKYEDEGHRQGTERIFKKVADSKAFKVVGGGDSESAIRLFGLTDKFDWISVGGGAALEFLTKGTLPGIEALK